MQEEALLSEERRIDELDLPRHEVVRRLRVLREPVTLFGEDDDARLARFKLVLKSGVIDAGGEGAYSRHASRWAR
jgi:pre-mRNA-splicing factor 18